MATRLRSAGSAMALLVVAHCAALVGAVHRDQTVFSKPPMGWRSWNGLGLDVNQDIMEAQMRSLAARRHTIDGKPTSLADLGYTSAGLDAGWVNCVNGTFHDKDGKPMVNTTRFPSMKAMTDYGHQLNLSVGWYFNPCDCQERGMAAHYTEDAQAVCDFGFDGIKVDACGVSSNMTAYAEALEATGRPMTAGVENCRNYAYDKDLAESCPFTQFRSTEDNSPDWLTLMKNLDTNNQKPFSGPSDDPHGGLPVAHANCFSYPDMLEVAAGGCEQQPPGTCGSSTSERRVGGLSLNESQAHFGAWAIVSSPLILGHDLTNESTYDAAWPVVSNPDVIAINQAWAGDAGRRVQQSKTLLTDLTTYHGRRCECLVEDVSLPEWVVYAKELNEAGTRVAALAINVGNATVASGSISVALEHLSPRGPGSTAAWAQEDAWRRQPSGTVAAGAPWQPPTLGPRSSFLAVLTAQ